MDSWTLAFGLFLVFPSLLYEHADCCTSYPTSDLCCLTTPFLGFFSPPFVHIMPDIWLVESILPWVWKSYGESQYYTEVIFLYDFLSFLRCCHRASSVRIVKGHFWAQAGNGINNYNKASLMIQNSSFETGTNLPNYSHSTWDSGNEQGPEPCHFWQYIKSIEIISARPVGTVEVLV